MDHVHAKGAFFQVGVYLVLLQGVKNLLNMLQMFCPSLFVNENVIQIHHYKIIGEWSQDIVHDPHESGWKICQYKGHDQPFENTFLGLEGGLPYICLFYRDLVVDKLHININEVFGPCELIKEVIDLGNQVPVSNCDFIQSLVINPESLGSIFLLYHHNWAPTR
jgi:hypothetical protein